MTEQKLEIPVGTLQPGTIEKDGVKQTVEVKEEYTYGITEERIKIPMNPYKFWSQLSVPMHTAVAIVNKIQDCYEVKKGTWHYIPRNDNEPSDPKLNASIEFYCIDDKKAIKRFTNEIKKYFPGRQVEWSEIDAEYLDLQKKLNNQ